MQRHTLSVLVEDKPGVLARVSGLFSRRGFNIESLAVGPTEHAEISRITILVSVEGTALEQVTKQLNKLVNVLKIVELEPAGRGALDQGDQARQRALAATGFADHRQGAAAVEGEADAAQRLDLGGRLEDPAADAIALLQALGRDDALAGGHAANPVRPG